MDTTETFIFLAALFAGFSAFSIALYFLEISAAVKVDTNQEEEARQLPILIRLFLPFAVNLKPLAKHQSFDMQRQQLGEKIIMAGYENAIDADTFIATRILLSAFGVLAFAALTIAGNPLPGLVLGAALHFYPQVWLKKTIDNRHRAIQRALPNVLDLLTLSVEAGKDFLTSLRDILARRKKDPLGEELERTFHEIQLGKKRTQAIKDLVTRVRQPDLTSVMNAIIQSDELGVSIAQLLKIQGDQLRAKRFQRAEKLANEAPVKMIFPIALFIAPAVMFIMIAPLAMRVFAVMFQ
jgi:tight adherence protein C